MILDYQKLNIMKIKDKNNQLVKRKGKLFVINKINPRMKAKQG